MQPQWSSEEMLDAFRALGGTAENIAVEDGELSARDPVRPVRLRIPENLLFALESFGLTDGSLFLKDTEGVSAAAQDFFGSYERAFGRAIFDRAAAAISALNALPAPVKDVLRTDLGMQAWFADDSRCDDALLLDRRTIWRGATRVIAPILELARHDPKGLPIEFDNGASISGPARHGVRVFQPFQDALAIFQRFGFAAAQPAAFSLPLTFVCDALEISVARELHLGERRGQVMVPQLNVVARNNLVLSHVMMGHSAAPRLARGIFCARMRDAGVKDPDAHFDNIAQENTAKLLKLLSVLEGEQGETALSLRRMARHQLEAMSWSLGSREV